MKAFWLAFLWVAAASATTAASTQTAAKLFNDSCTACHSIGGGDLAGPDLIKAAHMPRGDVEKAVRRMQDNAGPLTSEQIASLVDFLQSSNAKQLLADATNPAPVVEIPPEQKAASADTGRRLFYGEQHLENGGVPCFSCHAVSGRGGNLAADLTTIHARRSNDALLAVAQQPAFPFMKAAYRGHAVTKQEAYHLLAFFQQPAAPQRAGGVGPIAGGVTLVVFGGVAVVFRSRRAGVRSRMVHQ